MKNRATLSLAVASIVLFITGSAQGPLSASSVGSVSSSPDSMPVGLATLNISNESIASSSPSLSSADLDVWGPPSGLRDFDWLGNPMGNRFS